MSRSMLPYSVLVVFGAIGLAALVSCLLVVFVGVPAVLGGSETAPLQRQAGVNQELRLKLARPINLEKGIDPNTPLKDALEFLADRHDLNIIIDGTAFQSIGVQKAEEQPVSLPRMRNVPISTVLRMLVGQVRGDMYVGTYQIRDGYVEVTTTYHEFFAAQTFLDNGRPHLPAVTLEARGQGIDEALRELSETTAINIVLDAKVRDRAKKTQACALHEVPLDTAVQLLADQADLGLAIIDNVLYVTDRDNANQMQSDFRRRMKAILERENSLGQPPSM